jgi:citrate lyase beta subunit
MTFSPRCRSVLFVPATRPDRFAKAIASGADAVCLDLEDAIALQAKATARAALLRALAKPGASGVFTMVRINSLRSADGIRDIQTVLDCPVPPDALIVPKCDSCEEVRWLDGILGDACRVIGILPMIETARGLENAAAIAGAGPNIRAVAFGSADYAAEISSDMGWDALAYARGRLAAAAGGAGIAAIDGAWLAYDDDEGLRCEADRVALMGFAGKLAIHPRQVPVINAAFTPSADAVVQAERIVAAASLKKDGVTTLDGRMIDGPVVRAAQRVIARGRHLTQASSAL